jgi:hypothetical protein
LRSVRLQLRRTDPNGTIQFALGETDRCSMPKVNKSRKIFLNINQIFKNVGAKSIDAMTPDAAFRLAAGTILDNIAGDFLF